MSATVSVIGANGRVGAAIVKRLQARYDVAPITRTAGESPVDLAARAVAGTTVVINAAGVAHVERPTLRDLDRLRVGNVELPVAVAGAALATGVSMIHISSVKAAVADESSPYATSKREADLTLEREYGARFADAGLALVVVRPLAMLFPPFEAGRIGRLRFLRLMPRWATPAIRLPVLVPGTFLDSIELVASELTTGHRSGGFELVEFDRGHRGSMRDVREAMVRWSEEARR